jgi:hypothetical protein
MYSINAARVAPAATGRDPQVSNRASGAINISPTTPPNSVATTHDDRTAYLLAQLRCAALRARLAASEIDSVGVSLRTGWIDVYAALEWLREECPDALAYLWPIPPEGGANELE